MTAANDLTDLVQLSRTLGEPWRRFAILAEGNTSQRVAEDQLAVKATGRSLRHASAEDFVVVSLRRLSDIVDDSQAGDAEVARYFDELEIEQGMRPSVEALLHVVCVLDAGGTAVAHTHPESVNALLCSDRADVLAGPPIFPDQVVVIGRRALLVSYSDPGSGAGARRTCTASTACSSVGYAASDLPGKSRLICPRRQRDAGAAADGNG
ncbi:MAG TPA: class II aldolase/adducin family protein [Propionibacteriaceae bacterium]